MKAETKFNITLCVLGAILITLVWLLLIPDANAADHAIVSFNDAEHLAALQDSVVGVRDTVSELRLAENRPGKDGIINDIACYKRTITSITCRRLVGVTVTKPRQHVYEALTDYSYWCKGKAIIFYEPYKEEQ